MAQRLRSSKEDEYEQGYVFERMMKGLRKKWDEHSIVKDGKEQRHVARGPKEYDEEWIRGNGWSSGEGNEWSKQWTGKGKEREGMGGDADRGKGKENGRKDSQRDESR